MFRGAKGCEGVVMVAKGVIMVAKKDFHAAKHPEVEAVPNLHVIKALQVSY